MVSEAMTIKVLQTVFNNEICMQVLQNECGA